MKASDLKWIILKDKIIKDNNKRIIKEKEIAKLFCGDSKFHKRMREKIMEYCKNIKEENDQYEANYQKAVKILNQLPILYRQVLEINLVNDIPASVGCHILQCSMQDFYRIRKEAIADFESREIL